MSKTIKLIGKHNQEFEEYMKKMVNGVSTDFQTGLSTTYTRYLMI